MQAAVEQAHSNGMHRHVEKLGSMQGIAEHVDECKVGGVGVWKGHGMEGGWNDARPAPSFAPSNMGANPNVHVLTRALVRCTRANGCVLARGS